MITRSHALDFFSLACSRGLNACPKQVMLRTGTILGRTLGLLARRKRARVLANLTLAGSPDPAAAARRAWSNFGQSALEMLWMIRHDPAALLAEARIEGAAALTEPVAAGRGVLLVSAHVGNWEMVSLAAAAAGVPVAVIARRLRAHRLERRLIEFRERGGVRTLLRGEPGTGVTAIRWLAEGKVLGCMMDRSSSGPRMTIPFLGRTTRMPLGPLRMATKFRTDVVLGTAWREADGQHRIRFRRLGNEGATDEFALGRLVGRGLEADLRPRPENWLWIYRKQPFQVPETESAEVAPPPRVESL